jgi:hypothetical protein
VWILENVFETLKNRVKAQVSDIGQGEPVFPRNFRHVSTSRRAFVFRPGADASRALLGRFLGARARCARWGAPRALLRRSWGARAGRSLGRSWGALQALPGRFWLSCRPLCFARVPSRWAFVFHPGPRKNIEK